MADTVGIWIGALPLDMPAGQKLFVGSEQIYPVPAWAQWGATSIYGILSGDTSRPVTAGDATHAAFSIGDKPLSGKVYFEGEICSGFDPDSGTTGIGLATYTGGAIPTNGIGTLDTQLDAGSTSYRAFLYSAFNQIGADLTPHNTGTTYVYRFGIAYDATTRKAWVRQVYPGGPGGWILGGDPVAGTTPSYTMPGTDPVYIAGSARGDTHGDASQCYMKIIANPQFWLNAGVSGYAALDEGTRLIIGNGLGNANTGDSVSGSYSVVGNAGTLTWRRDGTTPPGITFSGASRSGSYTTAGTYTWYTTVLDGTSKQVAQLRETVTIASGAFALSGTLPSTATRGVAYSGTMTLAGVFNAPVTIDAAAGTIPAWMTAVVSGTTVTFSGTPNTTAAVSFTPRATDSTSGTAKVATGSAQSITVSAATITVGNGISGATTGSTASGSYTASGGGGSYTYSTTGTLPTGMTINSAGTRSGTFTTAGTYNFTVIATDAYGNTGSLAQTVVVGSIAVAGGLTNTTPRVGDTLSGTYTASGGTSPYTFSIPTGTFPTGGSVSSGGVTSGTFTTRGSYSWTIRATDAASATGNQSFSITVMANITISGSISTGTVGTAYSGSYTASGGTAPYTYTTTGTLPSGLSVSSSGVRSGTPTATGTSTFAVVATDANGDTQSLSQTVTVSGAVSGPTVRSTATNASTSGGTGSWSVPKPAGAAVGDILLICVHVNDFSGSLSAPAGFTNVGILNSSYDAAQFGLFWRKLDGTEGATITGVASSNSYADWAAEAICVQGASGSSPVTTATNYTQSGSTGVRTYTMPAITTTKDGTLMVLFEGLDVNARGVAAPVWAAPSGYTTQPQVNSNGNVAQVIGFTYTKSPAGSEAPTNTVTPGGTSGGAQVAWLIGVQPP